MGACLTKDEEDLNPSLTNLNDSRHVMMRRSSLQLDMLAVPANGSAYKPREIHIFPTDSQTVKDSEEDSPSEKDTK